MLSLLDFNLPKNSISFLGDYKGGLPNEYVIFALDWSSKGGIEAYIQTEHCKEPRFISQTIPSSWVTKIQELGDEKIVTMLPASWSHDGFFEDVENQKLKAIDLFNKEVEQIYWEEGMI